MTQTFSPHKVAGLPGFDAYLNARAFYRAVFDALRNARGHVVEQPLNAAESVMLNVAEGYPVLGADRARRFRNATAEAFECGAALDVLEIRGTLDAATLERLRDLLELDQITGFFAPRPMRRGGHGRQEARKTQCRWRIT